jgi:hypothetical protein
MSGEDLLLVDRGGAEESNSVKESTLPNAVQTEERGESIKPNILG